MRTPHWVAAPVVGSLLSLQALAQSPPPPPPLAAGSAAVQAAEDSRMPGELRPENRVLPQLALRIGPIPATRLDAEVVSGVHDGAARCAALRNKGERRVCQAARPRPVLG